MPSKDWNDFYRQTENYIVCLQEITTIFGNNDDELASILFKSASEVLSAAIRDPGQV